MLAMSSRLIASRSTPALLRAPHQARLRTLSAVQAAQVSAEALLSLGVPAAAGGTPREQCPPSVRRALRRRKSSPTS